MVNDSFTATKSELCKYVEKITELFDETNEIEYTTIKISEKLNISRNLASQYLNELVKEGVALKVNSRPVYFFDKRVIEKKYEVRLEGNIYFGMQELLGILKADKDAKRGFKKAIGNHARLRQSIEKLESAITYPNNGLPTILCGASGTGKSYLVSCAYEYMLDKKLIHSGGKLIIFHCEEYKNDPERTLLFLFGGKSGENDPEIKRGCIERANKGVLCLDDVEYLCPDALDRLYHFMDRGIFQRMGSENWVRAEVRLIFTTKESCEECIGKNLLHRIPIIIQIPPLTERTMEEKRRFLILFFKEEIKRTGYEFFVSQKTFDALLGYKYPGNITQMKNLVKTICANAIQRGEKGSLRKNVYFPHLPDVIVSTIKVSSSYNEFSDQMIDILNYKEESNINEILNYYEKLLSEYRKYQELENGIETFTEQGTHLADLYYNYLAFEKKYSCVKISSIEQILEQILEEIKDAYNIYLPFNSSSILSRGIYIKNELEEELTQWTEQHQTEISALREFCKQNFEEEFQMAEFFSERIYMELELHLDYMEKLFFLFQVKKNNQIHSSGMTKGIIICHGYSTASSIADTVNRIAGRNIYSAFDLPYEISIIDLQEHILSYVKRMLGYSNLIVLVDLGSLEEADTFLDQVSNINLAIVNNVSTRLALIIAMEIMRGTKLDKMLEEACKSCVSNYKILLSKKKESVILFVSENGVAIAQRFSELFFNSLPKKIDVKLIPYDYMYFLEKESKDILREQYDILFVTGTINPKLDGIAFVSMEDFMFFERIELVHKCLSMYLNEDEKNQFDQNLLKNFSLQNVVSYLTILNPVKVLEMVRDALEQLQIRSGIRLKPKMIIGLNIHISCLLERLIMKHPIESYRNIESFKKDNMDFIDNVKNSFSQISDHYGISIPIEEIAYIYDYITHGD